MVNITVQPRYEDKQAEHAHGPRDEGDALSLVVSALEEDIVLGRLHPRERLVEDDLMRRFSVKRHIVRQALSDLEQMAVVERVPKRGSMVRSFTAQDIQQLYVLRNLLETQAARLVPMPMAKDDVDDLKRIQVVHDAAVASGDLDLVFRSNMDFHNLLFSKTHNRYLVDAIKQFALMTHGIRFYCLTYPGYLEQARREHWLMIAAIESCDRQSLIDLSSQHLLASRLCYEKTAGLRAGVEPSAEASGARA
jgi:DNA-binding GntR family transcriptional regulator